MLGKHVLSPLSLSIRKTEVMSARRRGFERTHTARVQILDLPFLSCMAFGTVFYPLSLSLPVCPMGPVIPTLPGGVKSFICSMPVPLRGKAPDLWPTQPLKADS